MSLLIDRQIREYITINGMISPYDENRIRPASYDICVGDEYRFSHEKQIRKLSQWKSEIKLPPYSLCYVLSKEKLNLPNDISAIISSEHCIIREGILMYPQPPIDPGFKGRLYLLLHNLTSETRVVEKDMCIATLIFDKSTEEAEKPYGTIEDHKYQNAYTLEQMGLDKKEDFDPYSSALKELKDTIQTFRTELLSRWIPMLLIIFTVFLMVLTILFYFIGKH
jgi:deoxycytidine triphosphate deaminase